MTGSLSPSDNVIQTLSLEMTLDSVQGVLPLKPVTKFDGMALVVYLAQLLAWMVACTAIFVFAGDPFCTFTWAEMPLGCLAFVFIIPALLATLKHLLSIKTATHPPVTPPPLPFQVTTTQLVLGETAYRWSEIEGIIAEDALAAQVALSSPSVLSITVITADASRTLSAPKDHEEAMNWFAQTLESHVESAAPATLPKELVELRSITKPNPEPESFS